MHFTIKSVTNFFGTLTLDLQYHIRAIKSNKVNAAINKPMHKGTYLPEVNNMNQSKITSNRIVTPREQIKNREKSGTSILGRSR